MHMNIRSWFVIQEIIPIQIEWNQLIIAELPITKVRWLIVLMMIMLLDYKTLITTIIL